MYAKHIVILLLTLLMTVAGANAKHNQVQRLYIFGMAASFTDTIVYFTPVQEVDSAWVNKKDFLLGREEYSYQLRDYLAGQLLMPHRTCVVVFGNKRKKVEKKYAKMMRLYSSPAKNARQYDVRHISSQDFRFHSVNMSSTVEQKLVEAEQEKAVKKEKKGKEKKDDRKKDAPGPIDKGRRPPRGK